MGPEHVRHCDISERNREALEFPRTCVLSWMKLFRRLISAATLAIDRARKFWRMDSNVSFFFFPPRSLASIKSFSGWNVYEGGAPSRSTVFAPTENIFLHK